MLGVATAAVDRELRATQELLKGERDIARRYLEIATARNNRIQELQAELAHTQRLTELGQVVSGRQIPAVERRTTTT
jgi:hypothetical protein